MIVDETSPFYLASNAEVMRPLANEFRTQLYRMGVPFRSTLLSDLEAGRCRSRVYLFMGCFHLSAAQRDAIARGIGRDGRVVLWERLRRRPAGHGEPGCAIGDAVREIEGDTAAMIAPEPGAALCAGVPPEAFGVPTALRPLWRVEETDGLEVLGRFGDGTVGAAAVRRNGRLAVYIGTLTAPARLLRNILMASGVHVYLDSDDVLVTDGEFLSVTASSAGVKRLRLPKPVAVQRILPDAGDLGQVTEFAEPFAEGETRFYSLRAD